MSTKLAMPIVITLLVAFALALSSVHARGPELGQSSPLLWRAWQPLVSAFGGGDAQAAISYLRAGSAITRKAEAALARDAQTEDFRKQALASMEDFDLAGFHQLLPNRERAAAGAPEFRSFSFAGRPSERAYAVRALGAADGVFAAPPRSLPFGHSYGGVRMARLPHAQERRYALQLRSGVGLGALRWQALLAGLSDAGRLIETLPDRDTPLVLRAAETFLRTRQGSLGARDRAVLARVWGSFPGVAQVLLPISRTDDLVAESEPAPGATRVALATRWDLSGMRRKYPQLADYFDGLDDIARAHVLVSDAAGNTLLELDSDTAHLQTKIGALLQDGGVLARGRDGKALLPARFERMRIRADLAYVLHHIHLDIHGLELDVSYRAHAEGADFEARMTRVPKVHVSGAAFGLVPTRLLDWFIPGDTEGLARRMFQVAAGANGGRGALVEAHFRERGAGTTLELAFATELLDTALIRFCMAAIAEAAIPSDDQERDMTRLAIDYRDAFDADLARFAQFGAQTFPQLPGAP